MNQPKRSGKYRAGFLGLQSRFVRVVEACSIAAGGLALTVLAGLTVVAVFRRYALNDPIFGVEDLSAMTLTTVVAAAVAGGACRGAHVSVNVIGYFAGRRITRVSGATARLLGLGAAAVAAYALFAKGSCGLPCGAVTGSLSIVHTPFYYVLGTALAACALLLLIHFLVGLAHWSGEDPDAPGG